MDGRRVLASLVVALLVSVVVGGGVTALLDPYVWPSAVVGLPAGLVVGAVAGWVSYWRRRDTGDDPIGAVERG